MTVITLQNNAIQQSFEVIRSEIIQSEMDPVLNETAVMTRKVSFDHNYFMYREKHSYQRIFKS